MGDRRPSLEDLDTGLDPEGPIYKAIMSNPAIQLSLTNPKMLLGTKLKYILLFFNLTRHKRSILVLVLSGNVLF